MEPKLPQGLVAMSSVSASEILQQGTLSNGLYKNLWQGNITLPTPGLVINGLADNKQPTRHRTWPAKMRPSVASNISSGEYGVQNDSRAALIPVP